MAVTWGSISRRSTVPTWIVSSTTGQQVTWGSISKRSNVATWIGSSGTVVDVPGRLATTTTAPYLMSSSTS